MTANEPIAPASGAPCEAFPYFQRLVSDAVTLALSDGFALATAIWIAELFRAWFRGEPAVFGWSLAIIPAWWAGAVIMRLLPDWGIGPVEHIRRIVLLLTMIFGVIAAVLFLGKIGGTASRLNFSIAYFLSLLLVPSLRVIVKRLMIRIKVWGVPTVVYGSDKAIAHILKTLKGEGGLGYYPIGAFDDTPHEEKSVEGVPVLGGLSDTTDQACVAIVTTIKGPVKKEVRLLEGPLARYRRVVVIPDLLDAPSLWVTPRDFMGILGLEITSNLLNPMARGFKRVSEVILILLTLPAWLPVLGLLALLVRREDRGSPFFLQERVGYGGKVFKTIKFRTMHPDAEKKLDRMIEEGTDLAEEWETKFKLKQDPRVTRVGAFLRRTSLDELPQVINVLKGDMSLIGPRPLPAYHEDKLPDRVRDLRRQVHPGITGLWQVSGRSDSGNEGIERWDTYYVRNWSVWLDIVILMRTFRAVLQKQGAY